jgi:hypothetical protein
MLSKTSFDIYTIFSNVFKKYLEDEETKVLMHSIYAAEKTRPTSKLIFENMSLQFKQLNLIMKQLSIKNSM